MYYSYSVPYLKFNNLAFNSESEGSKLHPDSDLMFSLEFIVHNSLHQTTLANSSISNNDEFEKVVLGVKSLVCDDFISYLLDVF